MTSSTLQQITHSIKVLVNERKVACVDSQFLMSEVGSANSSYGHIIPKIKSEAAGIDKLLFAKLGYLPDAAVDAPDSGDESLKRVKKVGRKKTKEPQQVRDHQEVNSTAYISILDATPVNFFQYVSGIYEQDQALQGTDLLAVKSQS